MIGSSNWNVFRGKWLKASARVPGSGHLERDVPCQDRSGVWLSPRPCLMVLDGRGSAARSHMGAAASLLALRAAIGESDHEIARVLDVPGRGLAAIGWQGIACRLYHRAAVEQIKLAAWHESDPAEFEHTLTLCIAGHKYFGWLSVGDSPLVIRTPGAAGMVQQPVTTEFANQTAFVSASPNGKTGLQGGVIPACAIQGVLAMSDGTASKLMNHEGHYPAFAVSEILSRVGGGIWTSRQLAGMLQSVDWDHSTRDDRCLAVLARNERSTDVRGIYHGKNQDMMEP